MATSTKTGLRTAQLPAIDRVRFQDAAATRAWEQMRQTLEVRFGRSGNKLDRAVTFADLIENGFAAFKTSGGKPISGDADIVPAPTPDGIPPAPTGLQTSPGLAIVILQWDRSPFPYFGYAEVWRGTENNLSKAQPVGQTTGWIYSDIDVKPGVRYFYWVRFVSRGGKPGPFNGVAGAAGAVSMDPGYVMDLLSADDPGALLWKVTEPTEINGVPVAPGVYVRDLFVANGSISKAKIGLLAVDDARISSISVDKLLAGRLQLDQYIESVGFISGLSGFRINGDGTAEFNQVIVRGTVYATAGKIGGNVIDADGMSSAWYIPGSVGWHISPSGEAEFHKGVFRGTVYAEDGIFSGKLEGATGEFSGGLKGGYIITGDFVDSAWPASGKTGVYIGPDGLRIGNKGDNHYFEVLPSGDISAPGFDVTNGKFSISQLDVIDTLNIKPGAITESGSLSFGRYTGYYGVEMPVFSLGNKSPGFGVFTFSYDFQESGNYHGERVYQFRFDLVIDGVLLHSLVTPEFRSSNVYHHYSGSVGEFTGKIGSSLMSLRSLASGGINVYIRWRSNSGDTWLTGYELFNGYQNYQSTMVSMNYLCNVSYIMTKR